MVLVLPLFCLSQSLEDKVSQAKRLQAQSLLGADQMTLDSIVNDKKISGNRSGLKPLPNEKLVLDSLISGPTGYGQESMDDSIFESGHTEANTPDSSLDNKTQTNHRLPRNLKKRIPARYEQRIFRSIDRSTFGSTFGAAGRDYILGPGDQVTVSLWGDKEKEYNLTLSQDGTIFLEGLGLVALGGLNITEAQERLRGKLSKVSSGINRGTSHVEISLGHPGPIKIFVLGEVQVPGGFVFSGNTSVMSAMYFARGPSDIGTIRNLVLNRNGKKYPLDLYKYLIFGERLSPDALQDGDILFASRAEILAEISGDIGRPAVYELKKGEGIKELLTFSGNLNATAATHKMTLKRVFPDGRVDFLDLASPQTYLSGNEKFELQDGDKVLVERSSETSKFFYTVSGPVKYPGTYSSEGISTVKELVKKAGGLKEDAFLGRVHVVRFKPNGSSQLFAYSLDSTAVEAIPLEPRDNVILYSSKEMFLPDSVEIAGAVFEPGKYEFREGMSAKDLVMQAGGFLPHYESGRLVVFRGDPHERKVTQVQLDVEPGLMESREHYFLKPNDFIQVPVDPRWYKKEVVVLSGLFKQPGKYVLLVPGEKLTSVIERAGGFKDEAYITGGRLFRSKDSVGRVGLDFRRAVQNPNSKENIPLVGGDSIFVPERLNTVKVIGEVGFETSVLYKKGASVGYYIDKAGGFTRRSEKDHLVVEYANGETGGDGFFNRKPDAGSVIFVPQGPEPKQVDVIAGINVLLGTLSIGAALLLSIQALSSKK